MIKQIVPEIQSVDRGKLLYDETNIQKPHIRKFRISFISIALIGFLGSYAAFFAALQASLYISIYLIFGGILVIAVNISIIFWTINSGAVKVYTNGIIFPSQRWSDFFARKSPFTPYGLIKKIIWLKTDKYTNSLRIFRSDIEGYQLLLKNDINNIDEFIKACGDRVEIVITQNPDEKLGAQVK